MKKHFLFILFCSCILLYGCNNTNVISENPFFFQDVSKVTYKGIFHFEDDERTMEKDVIMNITEVEKLPLGIVYRLEFDSEKITHQGINGYYFYVKKDEIYKISATDENLKKLKNNQELSDGTCAEIICSNNKIKDDLSENELGWHKYITVNKNTREYHYYNNSGATTFSESFVWESNQGLIEYHCEFGADRESINLYLMR